MSYAELTRRDPNPIKRWLQERRLTDAVLLVPATARVIVDYGAGDGELAARLATDRPDAEVVAFEPAPELLAQARERLAGLPNARAVSDEDALVDRCGDVVLCTEVFEHLPAAETARALEHIARVLRPGGQLIVGVPAEIGPPALAKGLFRMRRRPGEHDASVGHVLGAAFGRPPTERPVTEIAPGRAYHPHHLGFDHRLLKRRLRVGFELLGQRTSPVAGLPSWLASELYLLAIKRQGSP